MTAIKPGAALDSPVFVGDPQADTPPPGDADGSLATTEFVAAAVTSATEKAIVLGKGGVTSDAADCADFPISVPLDCTLVRMKVTCKTAPSGAMHVQLRRAAAPITTAPSYSDVTGFSVTFTGGNVTAVANPADVAVSEGDFLNFSVSTADAINVQVEVVAVPL